MVFVFIKQQQIEAQAVSVEVKQVDDSMSKGGINLD